MKKVIFAAIAFLFSAMAMAAPDIVVGTNQNGKVEAVGTDAIYRVKNVSGVTSYVAGGTTYTLQDSDSSRKNKIVASFGANAIAYNGEVFDGAKGRVTCQTAGSLIVWLGVSNPDQLSDGCAYHQLAVSAGQAQ